MTVRLRDLRRDLVSVALVAAAIAVLYMALVIFDAAFWTAGLQVFAVANTAVLVAVGLAFLDRADARLREVNV